jgi:hypothetical protein
LASPAATPLDRPAVVDGSRALQWLLMERLGQGERLDEAAALIKTLLPELEAGARGAETAPDVDQRLCLTLSHLLADGVFIYKFWQSLARLEEFALSPTPHGCGEALLVSDAWPTRWEGGARRLWACTRCGTIGDTPRAWSLPDLHASGGTAQLDVRGVCPGQRGWVAGTVEGVGLQTEHPLTPRPLASGDEGPVQLPVETVWPMPGLRWFSACVVRGGEFAIVRAAFRSEAAWAGAPASVHLAKVREGHR